jgi:broad specificity phosphatase PhoE
MVENNFYFIRHGETDWNREHRIMGQKDIPLNATGKLQAQNVARLLKICSIKTICHSPLIRAKETALILNETLKCQLIEVDSLKECCWGTFEGELKGDKPYLEQWINGLTPESAESCDEFKLRVLESVKLSLIHQNPLIVSHGGVYWALQQLLCKNIVHHNSAQNCVPFHFSLSGSNEWTCVPLESLFEEEPFDT